MGSKYPSVFHANALKDEILLAIQKAKDFKHQHKHHKARTKSNENYIIIYPNNDLGFNLILESYKSLRDNLHFRF